LVPVKMETYKLAIVVSHPIQYQVPLYKKLAQNPRLDLTVYFCADFGLNPKKDPGFGVSYKWDIPLLDGYRYKFLTNYSVRPSTGKLGQINPGIISELFFQRYDAVLVHGYTTVKDWLTFIGAWLSRTPIFVRGETHLLLSRSLPGRLIRKIALPICFKNVSSFLSIGSKNRDFYKYYNVPDNKIVPTPYSVDNKRFKNSYTSLKNQRDHIKKQLNLPPNKRVILYASKMTPRKRPMDLLKAYEKINHNGNLSLVFVGDGELRYRLEHYAKDVGLKNVHFFGFQNQSQLPMFYSIADVFVLPSENEPWGLVINEVMNFQVPIVTTDLVGSAYDLVKQGENGYVYKCGDFNALADCLNSVLEDIGNSRRMGKSSQEIISKWSYKEDEQGILSALYRCCAR